MSAELSLEKEGLARKCYLIAAYDAGMRNSEGYVARSILERLDRKSRIILITRKNNVAELLANKDFRKKCPNVYLVGFDLPKWAMWWKRGHRFYGLYAYLWQVVWPFVVNRRYSLRQRLTVVHTLNFHNDSYPNMAWVLGRPTVWGPINHNEVTASWRTENWPVALKLRNNIKSAFRRLFWKFDPLLELAVRRTDLIFSAGSWVDYRLGLSGNKNVLHRSQLGLDANVPTKRKQTVSSGLRLVSGGRLDWIKGLDIAIAALVHLPKEASLTLIGDGPCRDFLGTLAHRLGVSERVVFFSSVSREELLEMYENFDLFLFTSSEAGGLSWVEALATGLPVVAFEGKTEITDKSSMFRGVRTVPCHSSREKNIIALAETILEVACSKHDSKAIVEEVCAYYDWDVVAKEIQEAYRIVSVSVL